MEALKKAGTEDSPEIILDREANNMELSGRSLPEDVITFYEPVLSWIEEYSKNPLENTVFNFKFSYFNTASSKVILDILTLFEEMIEEGNHVLVRWHFADDDEDMQEAGEEYSDMVDVPFEMVMYS
ncbi:hypothetical protein LCGC14_2481860 [marine sediment metagenome]|uniref:SiaC family regulatory phosphoprotein domain-containing protein n=1 Tax=marine sediment metagenome TaxID=412755 RepID=A0A0F9B863_9ZZZZ|nr:DUF1987 domain-containing protein [Bacteroides sp.]